MRGIHYGSHSALAVRCTRERGQASKMFQLGFWHVPATLKDGMNKYLSAPQMKLVFISRDLGSLSHRNHQIGATFETTNYKVLIDASACVWLWWRWEVMSATNVLAMFVPR